MKQGDLAKITNEIKRHYDPYPSLKIHHHRYEDGSGEITITHECALNEFVRVTINICKTELNIWYHKKIIISMADPKMFPKLYKEINKTITEMLNNKIMDFVSKIEEIKRKIMSTKISKEWIKAL